MTNPHDMTDEQLCMAISLKREPKPEYTYIDGALSYDKAWVSKCVSESCGNLVHTEIFEWRPINWLSWENAGGLLEEMAPIQIMRHPNGKYTVDIFRYAKKVKIISNSFGRGVGEAWIMVNS